MQYMFCDPNILRHRSGGSLEGATSGVGPKADLRKRMSDVGYSPNSDIQPTVCDVR
jgi:hypothetical protein